MSNSNLLTVLASVAYLLVPMVIDAQTVEVDSAVVTLKSASAEPVTPFAQGPKREMTQFVTLLFDIRPKNPSDNIAFELGDVLIARDKQGKILGTIPMRMSMNNDACYWTGKFGQLRGQMGRARLHGQEEAIVSRLPFSRNAPTEIASLEADLFVAKLEVFDFAFSKDEFRVNADKELNGSRAKVVMIDESPSGSTIGLTIDIPRRSNSTALAGRLLSTSPTSFQLLAETDKGAFVKVPLSGRTKGGGDTTTKPDVERIGTTLSGVKLPDFKTLHILVWRPTEYPRAHRFNLNDIKVRPAGQKANPPVGGQEGNGRPIAVR